MNAHEAREKTKLALQRQIDYALDEIGKECQKGKLDAVIYAKKEIAPFLTILGFTVTAQKHDDGHKLTITW